MKKQIKFALTFLLLSSTSLSTYAEEFNNANHTYGNMSKKVSSHKGIKNVKSKYPKHKYKDVEPGWPAIPLPLTEKFVPFTAKSVLLTFGNELDMPELNKDYEGKLITLESVTEINNKIVDCFIKHDYLLPIITLDKDAMLSGILKLDVKAASINEVILMGSGTDNKLLTEYAAKIASNKPAKKSYVQKYLALMNKIPGFEVSYELKENENSTKNETLIDLVVHTYKKHGSAFVGADDFGTNSLGKYQAHGLVEAYTPFSSSDSLLFHGSTTNHPDRLSDVGTGYSYILNAYGTAAHVFASYSKDNPTEGQQYTADSGKGTNLRGAISHPLFLNANHDLELELGSTYKHYTSYDLVNNVSQKYKVSKYTSGDIGLSHLFKDGLDGQNLLKVSHVHGISGTYKNYIDGDFADKHFKIFKADFQRLQPLPQNFSFYTHMSISHSNNNLPDTELSFVGGQEFGRGYDFGTLDGTKMHGIAAEVRYTKQMDEKYCIEHLQPYIFGDYSHINRQDPSTTVSHLESAGAGLRIRFIGKVDLGMEVAQPMKKNFVVDQTNIKAETKFNVFINKVFEF